MYKPETTEWKLFENGGYRSPMVAVIHPYISPGGVEASKITAHFGQQPVSEDPKLAEAAATWMLTALEQARALAAKLDETVVPALEEARSARQAATLGVNTSPHIDPSLTPMVPPAIVPVPAPSS